MMILNSGSKLASINSPPVTPFPLKGILQMYNSTPTVEVPAAVGDVEDSDFYVPDEGDLVFYGRDRRDPGLPVAVAATSGDVPASGDVKWTLGLGVLSNMQQFFDSLRTNLESLEQLPHEDKEALLGQHVASAPAIMLGLELEQRTNIKFLVKLGKSKSEIREMLVKVYGDNAMKKTAVHKWAKRFSAGRESVTDEERSGRPATSRTGKNIAKVRQIVRENCRLTVRGIAQQAKIDRETVRKILTEDLDMRKVCAKMVYLMYSKMVTGC
ncbi:hypothetical protein B7P43_G01737 [Cryptotermes secundus]|uniref:Mos1 transposase HTH domain-containing protein n=1 Tax=Cryptotermes secundus TaxID=105785 RepID=A0A2J7R3L6_9NEOP|nr:hypothetical protein B7P43_G01737 [Cryptotermes secundus]